MADPTGSTAGIALQDGEGTIEVQPGQQVLEVSKQFASFHILAKADEREDKNFPPHLHAAFQLFCMTGNLGQAAQVKKDVDALLLILSSPPDGKPTSMGTACVCWGCGRVGLPRNADAVGESLAVAGQCAGCGEDDQTNFVQLKQPDGTVVPWIERKEGKKSEQAEAAAAGAGAEAGAGGRKAKPNEPCPCGSGKKHKKCCGGA